MQSDTIDVDEASLRRMIALGFVGKSLIDDHSGNHQADRRDSGGRHRIFPQSTTVLAASDGEGFFSMRM
ncbi:hypothetical protein BraRD5C2_39720 [Bradyrhizobium sp. RD5-C2]|nr:hypothetical protein BraRD5C2_39720 [Bradyrhizobium sp. RD5-C2]